MAFNIRNQLAFIALLCIVFCFTTRAQDKIMFLAQPEVKQALLKEAQVCSKQTGIPAAALQQILDWPMSETRASKQFFQCVCYNTGYTDESGHFVIDTFLDLKIVNGTKEQITNLMDECNKITLPDPVETAFAIGDCAHKYFIFAVEK